jgi:hypothetical protein
MDAVFEAIEGTERTGVVLLVQKLRDFAKLGPGRLGLRTGVS